MKVAVDKACDQVLNGNRREQRGTKQRSKNSSLYESGRYPILKECREKDRDRDQKFGAI